MNKIPDDADIAELADMFHLLGDATRLRILMSCLDEPLAVSDIAARLELTLSLVSHHLRLLRAARLVRSERLGKQVSTKPPTSTSRASLPACWITCPNPTTRPANDPDSCDLNESAIHRARRSRQICQARKPTTPMLSAITTAVATVGR
jgi:DNA-binding transcriptional ArsR family regulator